MEKTNKKILCLFVITILFSSFNVSSAKIFNLSTENEIKNLKNPINNFSKISSYEENNDIDPLVDLEVTVTIKEIRALDKLDKFGKADFYVIIFINDVKFKSKIWYNQNYIKEPWSVTLNVPDEEENVSIKIQLWDWNLGKDKLCDISNERDLIDKRYIDVVYSLKAGHWRGDDYVTDSSGYGRANGCDDRSISIADRDCELWFDISQNDYDGDSIPYWIEVNNYITDPKVNDSGRDDDGDGVPIEWEFKWGHRFMYDWHSGNYTNSWVYDPFKWEDHANLDPDKDGLQNIEEYLTSQWGSDPFRQDIFIELDQMEEGPNGEGGFLPELSKDLIRDAFSKRNIVFLIDDGYMGGGELIPFKTLTSDDELRVLYKKYFLHGDSDNWRRGAFHYTLLVYNASYPGFVFSTRENNTTTVDSLQLSTRLHDWGPIFKFPIMNIIRRKSLNIEYHRAIAYASVLMHETGHLLGITGSNTPGCDKRGLDYQFKYIHYVSCMNYFYVYYKIDYSDGSHGKYDFDDWDRIDLTLFQIKYTN